MNFLHFFVAKESRATPACLCLSASVFMSPCCEEQTLLHEGAGSKKAYHRMQRSLPIGARPMPGPSVTRSTASGNVEHRAPAKSLMSLMTPPLPGSRSLFSLVYLFLDLKQPPWPHSAFFQLKGSLLPGIVTQIPSQALCITREEETGTIRSVVWD